MSMRAAQAPPPERDEGRAADAASEEREEETVRADCAAAGSGSSRAARARVDRADAAIRSLQARFKALAWHLHIGSAPGAFLAVKWGRVRGLNSAAEAEALVAELGARRDRGT